MTDPLLSLAFSLHTNKGVFALLLGSGISRPAGIPTGWEVVLDLTRKLAQMKSADCKGDPVTWYRDTFGVEADYSKLLDAIARAPAERQQLLKSYFEPNEEERRQKLKLPTPAHHAIAQLVARGHVRVIVTTNFDRLLENALELIGIIPVVISTPDAVAGAVPLAHLSCVIIKPNGDYLDSRIKNTESELASYAPAMRRLLGQVFDEYGLIICGWSGDWDSGLRSAISRSPNRRFTTYWATRSDLSDAAQRLVVSRNAEIIRITDADTFFVEVEEKVRSLTDAVAPHVLSAKVAAATVKRYVADPQGRIRLHDFFVRETNTICDALNQQTFPHDANPSAEEINVRSRRFESLTDVLLSATAVVVFWGEAQQVGLVTKTIERIGNANVRRRDSGTFFYEWQRLHRYPALLLIFAAGLTALAASKFETLLRILTEPMSRRDNHVELMILNISSQSVRYPPDPTTGRVDSRRSEDIGYSIQRILRPHLEELIADEQEYVTIFHSFEYLLGLVISDLSNGSHWWPAYFARSAFYMQSHPIKVMDEEIATQGANLPLLRAGMFGGSLDRLAVAKAALDEHLGKMGW